VIVLFISLVFLGCDLCMCWDGHLLQFYLIDILVTTLLLRAQPLRPLRERKPATLAVVTAFALEASSPV
jgi:hypothetical protein